MKIKLLFALLVLCNFSYAQTNLRNKVRTSGQNFYGKLTSDEFMEFKFFVSSETDREVSDSTNYIINYKQPVGDCFYDQYRMDDCDHLWYEENIYSLLPFDESVLNLYFQHKEIKNKNAKECLTHYDTDNYLYSHFFEKSDLCWGLIIVNNKGEFRVLMGEYLKKDVLQLMKQLKI
ncbi:hypothetical protein [Flavobacterium humi]|uniref:DUF4348 domain-containing protein n=1 Tax=Flavobacterium humi TaxID=2562683 RepID=A0A4Z0L7S2_9FLAO|nr:hypothetical protein [Flavobacterium humi]TGD58350.1 hypothetical protein E4635_05410 [Flavobacterium humi]